MGETYVGKEGSSGARTEVEWGTMTRSVLGVQTGWNLHRLAVAGIKAVIHAMGTELHSCLVQKEEYGAHTYKHVYLGGYKRIEPCAKARVMCQSSRHHRSSQQSVPRG